MVEKVRREHAPGDGGDLLRVSEQMAVEYTEVEAPKFVVAEEVRGYRCTKCLRVFSTGRALGGHTSSAHGSPKKFDSSSKKPKSMKVVANKKNSTDPQMGQFTCKYCGKGFPSEKGMHGHMRLHSSRARGGAKPPTKLEIENPVKYSSEPEIPAGGLDSEPLPQISPIIKEEDFIKNLREKTVKGRRGRRGSEPHKVDSPETCLLKKRALLSGDPRELRKIMDHHDYSGYFRRAFGKFLDFLEPEIEEKRDALGDSHIDVPEKVEHGKGLEGTTSVEIRLTGKKRKRQESNFAKDTVTKKMKIEHPNTSQG